MKKEIRHEFRNLESIEIVMPEIIARFPDLDTVQAAIYELMLNAIEHGILGIEYDEKTRLLAEDRWLETVKQRLKEERFTDRAAYVEVSETNEAITVEVRDDGNGFAWQDFVGRDIAVTERQHGRGIALCEAMCKTLTYIGEGNRVVAVFDRG